MGTCVGGCLPQPVPLTNAGIDSNHRQTHSSRSRCAGQSMSKVGALCFESNTIMHSNLEVRTQRKKKSQHTPVILPVVRKNCCWTLLLGGVLFNSGACHMSQVPMRSRRSTWKKTMTLRSLTMKMKSSRTCLTGTSKGGRTDLPRSVSFAFWYDFVFGFGFGCISGLCRQEACDFGLTKETLIYDFAPVNFWLLCIYVCILVGRRVLHGLKRATPTQLLCPTEVRCA